MSRLNAQSLFLFMAAATSFCFSLIFTVNAVYYVQTVGLDPLQLVLLGTAMEGAAFFFEVPTGVIADTYSRRLSIIIGQFVLGFSYTAAALVPSFGIILITQAVAGIGFTFISGAEEAWIADEVGEEKVGPLYLRASQVQTVVGLVGMIISVGLATIRLNLPILVGGIALVALGLFLIAFMPEQGFHPVRTEGHWSAMTGTLRTGIRLIRARPRVLTILGIAAIFGAFSEGFDRLWQAHFLKNFTFPGLASFEPVVWIGIISISVMPISLLATEIARRRLDTTDHVTVARALLALNSFLITSIVAFGLAGNFAVALAAFWSASLLRKLNTPLYTAWLNQNVSSEVRATVFSISNQADASGQVLIGPILGWIGAAFSLRAAMVASALILSPALALYRHTLRRDTVPLITEAQPIEL